MSARIPLSPRMGLLALGIGLGVAALGADDRVPRHGREAREHLARRLPVIRADLAAASPGFVFLAGNSHAELLGDALARHLPLVNAGIGGASARSYAVALDGFPIGARARVAVLFLGTNDILRGAAPLSQRTLGGFVAATARILAGLRARADRVLVAAVPPIGPEAGAARDPAAVAAYTAALRDLCADGQCRFFDPFATLRDAAPGLTTQAVPPDGVHLRDYEALAADLAPSLRGIDDAGPGRYPNR